MYIRKQQLGFLSTVVKAVSGGAKVASGVTRAASTASKVASAASSAAKVASSAASAAANIGRTASGLTKAVTGGTRSLTSAAKTGSGVARSIASVAGAKGAGSIVEIATAAPTISSAVKNAPPQLVQAVTDAPSTSGGNLIRGLTESVPAALELYALTQGGGLVAAGAAATDSPIAPENQYPTGVSPTTGDDYTNYLPPGGSVAVTPQIPEWLLPVGIGAALLLLMASGDQN